MEDLDTFAHVVGQRVRQLRRKRDLKLEDVANQARLSISHLSQVERGAKLLSLKALLAIARSLQLSRKELLSILADGLTEGFYLQSDNQSSPSQGLQANIVTVGSYSDPEAKLQALRQDLQSALLTYSIRLPKAISITPPRGAQLHRLSRKSTLIIDATGLFIGPSWGTPTQPFTHAGLVAASNNIPYAYFVRRRDDLTDREMTQLSGWTDVYQDGGYFSEDFEDEQEMMDYFQAIILPRAIHRWTRSS